MNTSQNNATGTSDTTGTKANGKPFLLTPVEGTFARFSPDNVCVAREDFLRANEVLAGKSTVHVDHVADDVSDAPTVSVTDDDEQLIQQGRELARIKDENAAILKDKQRLVDENERLKHECAVANVFSLREVPDFWQLPLNAENQPYVPAKSNISVVTQLLNTDVRVTPVELPMRLGDPEARIGVAGDYIVHVAIVPFQDGPRYVITYEHSDLDDPLIQFRPLKGLKNVRIKHRDKLVVELTFLRRKEAAVIKAFSLKAAAQYAATKAMETEQLSAQLGAGESAEGEQR